MLRLGKRRAVIVLTLIAVVTSTPITFALILLQGLRGQQLIPGLLISCVVATVVTATATHLLLPLFFELEEARKRLLRMATHDSLTEVHNRRFFIERLEAEAARSARTGEPLSLLMIDADHFKAINDEHGHVAGDDVLREIASVCGRSLRPYDVLARYGGEEFVVLMPNVALDDACRVAERIRATIGEVSLSGADDAPIRVTVSIGIAARFGGDPHFKTLLDSADKALYAAKRQGRNRCVNAGAISGPGGHAAPDAAEPVPAAAG